MNDARLGEIIARHELREGPLLPLLHEVQAQQGFVGEDDIRAIALALNLSRAEVSGVVGFYHDFRRAPEPLPQLKLCRAEACQSRGVETLVDGAMARADGRVKIDTVYCLGLCAIGPSAMIEGQVFAHLDESALAGLIDGLAAR